MSLVGNYCYCSDGNWYADPIWKGTDEDGKQRWFLILDDDDDPEIIYRIDDKEKLTKKEQIALLPKLEWFEPCSYNGVAGRYFGGPKFSYAFSVFGQLIAVPPPPQSGKKVGPERPSGQGVYFDPRRASKDFLNNPCGRY